MDTDTRRASRWIPLGALTALWVLPTGLASTVLVVLVLAGLPPSLQPVGYLTGIVLIALPGTGRFHRPAVRLLAGARGLTSVEHNQLAPVLVVLTGRGIPPPGALLLHPAPGVTARAYGGPTHAPTLVVSAGLVAALRRQTLTAEEAAAVLAHALGRHHTGRHRGALPLAVWTAPARALAAVLVAAGRRFALLRLIWHMRLIVAPLGATQAILHGNPGTGVMLGTLVLLTLIVPTARRARDGRLTTAGDHYLRAHGLGAAFVALAHRHGPPLDPERAHRLHTPTNTASTTSAHRPTLQLVHR